MTDSEDTPAEPDEHSEDDAPPWFAPDLYANDRAELSVSDAPPSTGGGDDGKNRQSAAVALTRLARNRYDVIRGLDGRPYAVAHARPGLALELRGRGGLRQALAKSYLDSTGKVAGEAALTSMLTILEGDALESPEQPVCLRFGSEAGRVYVDLGRSDGAAVEVYPGSWHVRPSSPVLFRRSPLIGELPDPSRRGSLEGLRELLNVDDQGFRLLIGWMVACYLADIPRPILALFGQQGTAKTTAMRMIRSLVDPSPAATMSPPRNDEDWAVNAFAAPVIALDNVSHMSPWFQDALCKAVTGDGVVRRERYSDDTVTVLSFKRAIALTSIDPGAMQGDVAERLLTVELEPIPADKRRTDREVNRLFEGIRAEVFGALMDLLCRVLAELPSVHLETMPRMADFARVLAALDKVQGWTTLADYTAGAKDNALTVVEGDAFATSVKRLVHEVTGWSGTASDLLARLTPDNPPRSWPKTAQSASAKLKRMTPALREVGISVEFTRTADARGIVLAKIDTPTCTICAGRLAPALIDAGQTTHPTCSPNDEELTP